MLVSIVPAAQNDLAGVGLLLLDRGVVRQAHVVDAVELEERAALAARLRHDEVVERVVVRNDDVLFDVHELIDARHLQLVELVLAAQLLETLVEELLYAVALLEHERASMARAVPIRVRDLDVLVLQTLLLVDPFLA